MLGFVDTDARMPNKRTAKSRIHDFGEIYGSFDPLLAHEQSNRCSQCGVPFCQVHCPLHNNIPDWLRLTAEGRFDEAYALSSATNDFPEICGRICPQDRLCEGNCTTEQSGHGAITIGAVEKHLTDMAWEQGWVQPFKPDIERSDSIGIVGAGPAGLAAAGQLRQRGYQVTVYDRYDRVGGLLVYGIPSFKLEKHIVLKRHEQLVQSGIHFVLNTEVGVDISFEELRSRHVAVLLAQGVYKTRDMKAPGCNLSSIVPALDFLTVANRKSFGDTLSKFDNEILNASGRQVVVIGGGDTAMDCVRTAVRQGAKSVQCLYRRDRENMPGSEREVSNAIEEGVEFLWCTAPEAFDGQDCVESVLASKVHLGTADATGRRRPEIVPNSNFKIKADLVIQALGFEPKDVRQISSDITLTNWGTIKVNHLTKQTNLPGVYAAGDIVRGASLVVWAIRDGRDAAAAIDSDLSL